MISVPRSCQVRRGLSLFVLLFWAWGAASSARAAERQPLPAGTEDRGPVEAGTRLRASLFLQPEPARAAALAQFLTAVETPGSAEYRHWLTAAVFNARFGATDAQVARVRTMASAAGLTVEAVTGLRVQLGGSVSAFEAAFAPALHTVQTQGKAYVANTVVPSVPAEVNADALALTGLATLPQPATQIALMADAQAVQGSGRGPLEDLAASVEANTSRVLALSGNVCASALAASERAAFQLVLQQAAAQGIAVLAESGCADAASASFPASLPEAAGFVVAPALTQALPEQPRPAWQNATGLPNDGLRHAPDAAVFSLAALSQALLEILAKAQPSADGTPARLGNIAPVLYSLATAPGLFTQTGAPAGTWEPASGLGTLDVTKLGQFYPMGSFASSVSVTLSNPGATHGQNITFTSAVKDISGQGGGATPTGTVIWTTNSGITLGPQPLVNGSASVTTNTLPAAPSYSITAQYSGDANYAASSASTGFTVSPEPAVVGATVSPSTPLGGTVSVAVTVSSKSGVGTPTGSASVAPQGTADKNTYTAPLVSTTPGTASATVTLPALQGGNVTLLVNCITSSGDFSCYVPLRSTATVTTGRSTTAIALTTAGGNTTLTATVTGAGAGFPAPTGNVSFSDNGQSIGSGTLAAASTTATSATASTSFTTPSSGTHSYTATYGGDNNYAGSTSPAASTGTSPTNTSLTVSPNPPVSGATTTLTASIGYTASGSAVPTGSVSFYMDGAQLGTASVTGGTTAAYTSTAISGSAAHSFYAVYSGDAVYKTSQSTTVSTPAATAAATTTTLAVAPNPPVSGAATTLTATVGFTASGSTVPTGAVSFYMDGAMIGSGRLSADGKTATFSSTTISSAAAHSFYAVYSGDANFITSQSAPVSTTAAGSGTTGLVLAVTPNPPVSGSPTSFTAALTYSSTGTAPTGTVTFSMDGARLGTATLSSTGTASFTSLTVDGTAAHSFTAAYSGDANYTSSQSQTVKTQGTSSNATTTTIVASAASLATGGTTTFTATVTTATASGTAPTGLVAFTSSAQGRLGTAALSSAGTATLTPTLTTIGVQHVTATYAGDTTWQGSTTLAPADVTVGPASGLTLTVSPTPVSYGSAITFNTTVTATPTSGSPAGTVSWSVTPNAGGTAQTYSAALAATSGTSATAATTIAAPAVGTYGVTATCTGTNITCTGLTASSGFAVTKAPTTITISASPSPPVSGTPELLTAYVALSSGASAACGGSVSFYVNGAYAGNGSVSGNQATFILTLPNANSNTVYAIYTGDANCQPGTSSVVTLSVPPTATTGTVSVSNANALQGSSLTFTAVVSATATTNNPYPGTPTGYVNFYDTFNGVQALLGSASLVQNGVTSGIATFTTTGLQTGTHSVHAQFTGSTRYSPADAGIAVVTVTDFSVSFAPATATAARGQTVTALATVVPLNGFTGQVVLSCTPPGSTYTTCGVSPSVMANGSGIATLTITTTAATHAALRITGTLSLAGLLATLLWPGARRRRLPLLCGLALACACSLTGCTSVQSQGSTAGGDAGSAGGTPSGTQIFTIVAAGSDGRTTNRHTYQFQVTVQ